MANLISKLGSFALSKKRMNEKTGLPGSREISGNIDVKVSLSNYHFY